MTASPKNSPRPNTSLVDIHSVGVGIAVVSYTAPEGWALESINRSAALLLGVPNQFQTERLETLLAPGLYPGLANTLQTLVETHETREVELRRSDGPEPRWLRVTAIAMDGGDAATRLATLTVLDVTQQKHAVSRTMASEMRFTDLVEGSIQAIAVVRDDRVLFANAASETISGYPVAALLHGTVRPSEFIHPADREAVLAEADRLMSGDVPEFRMVYRIIRQDGAVVWVEVVGTQILWEEQRAMQLTLMDVTQRELAQQELRESRALLEAVFDALPVRVMVKDLELNFLLCNRLLLDEFELSTEEVQAHSSYTAPWLTPQQREEGVSRDLAAIESGERVVAGNVQRVMPDGRITHNQTTKVPLRNEAGEVVGLISVTQDVTAQRRAEQVLRTSEIRYRTLVESSLHGIAVHRNGRAVFVNGYLANLMGYDSPEALVAEAARKEPLSHVSPEERLGALKLHEELQAGVRDEYLADARLQSADGRWVRVRNQLQRIEWEGAPAVMTTLIDVTAQAEAEEALAASEARLRGIVANAPVILWALDAGGTITISDGKGLPDQGFKPGELVGRSIFDVYADHPLFLEQVRRALGGESVVFEMETFGRTYERWLEPVRDADGRVIGVTGVSVDLTERKHLERDLERSRTLLNAVFDAMPVWACVKDRDHRYIMANQAFADCFGVPQEQILNATVNSVSWLTQDARERSLASDRQVLETGQPLEIPEAPMMLPDGRLMINRILRVPLRDADGKVIGIVQVGQEITHYKQVEAELAASEGRYRTLVESSLQGITVHAEGRPVFVNDTYARWVGYQDADEFLSLNRDKLLPQTPAEWRDQTLDNIRRLESGEIDQNVSERTTQSRDGQLRDLFIRSSRIDWDGRPAVLSTILDVTERNAAVRTLKASEERYRALIEGSVQAITIFSLERARPLFVNEAMLRLMEVESVAEYMASATLLGSIQEPNRRELQGVLDRMRTGEQDRHEGELQAHPKGAEAIWVHYIIRSVDWEGEAAVQFTLMDITARKRAEEALRDNQAVLVKQNEYYRQDLSRRRGRPHEGIVAESAEMRRVLHEAEMVARSRVAVLIEGETGSGKEVVAEFIHRNSDRADHILSVVNCGALTENLMDAELFGHERGAFTGATEARAGLVEIADKGTLFLDEIGDLPPSAQVRLLRFLERGVVRRVGSNRERKVDVRILAATHKTLRAQVEAGTFREDLYHRLLVIRIEVPPLRERVEDIVPLARHFAQNASKEAHSPLLDFSDAARLAMTNYPWPGNVRELAHAVQRAVFAAKLDGVTTIQPIHLDLPDHRPANTLTMSLKEVTQTAEQRHVQAVLRHFEGNRRKAAEALGVSERHLYRLLG